MKKAIIVTMSVFLVMAISSAAIATEKEQTLILETPSGNQHVIVELKSATLNPEKGEGLLTLLSYELMNRGWKVVLSHAGSLKNPRTLVIEHSGKDGGWFYLKGKTSEKGSAHSHHSLRDLKRRGLNIINVLADDIERLILPTPEVLPLKALVA